MQQVRVRDVRPLVEELVREGRQLLLLDVREPWERQIANLTLPGTTTLAIPMPQVPKRLAELDPDWDVLVLCHHGMRSLQVAWFLSQQGYPYAYNITGGIDAWSAEVDPQVPRY
ncbi:MAG: rhodanese-like domain-containing protein [Leptothrix sp. (in: b-proteobacteria)]|jgi:rhodanese-related sulfurtransferase